MLQHTTSSWWSWDLYPWLPSGFKEECWIYLKVQDWSRIILICLTE